MKHMVIAMFAFISNTCFASALDMIQQSNSTGFFYNSFYSDRVRLFASSQEHIIVKKLLCDGKTELECKNILSVAYPIFAFNSGSSLDGYNDWVERKAKVDGAMLEQCVRSVTMKYLTANDEIKTDKIVSFCENEIRNFTSDIYYSSTVPNFVSKYLTDDLSIEQMKKFIGVEIKMRSLRKTAKHKK